MTEWLAAARALMHAHPAAFPSPQKPQKDQKGDAVQSADPFGESPAPKAPQPSHCDDFGISAGDPFGAFGPFGDREKQKGPSQGRDSEIQATNKCLARGLPSPPDSRASPIDYWLARERLRPPAWPGGDDRPQPGAACSCCGGNTWWGDASGWCCTTCHPPPPGTNPNPLET